MKVLINVCHGGFGISDAAYERLIELGVPVRAYVKQERGEDGLYKPQPLNDGGVIFDRDLDTDADELSKSMRSLSGRYWDSWDDTETRTDPLVLRVVEELGEAANGRFSRIKAVDIPDDVEWEIEEYDGLEWIAEAHQTWS